MPPPLHAAAVRRLAHDDTLYDRAEALWASGGVIAASRRGATLLGTVRGTQADRYRVSVEPPAPSKRRWQWQCDCFYHERYGGPCKHSLALLLAWANEPERILPEPTLDERLAGPERAAALNERREQLRQQRALQRLLALEPERKQRLGRTLDLAPYEEQARYALSRNHDDPGWQADRLRGLLESAAGLLRVGDADNAVRLATLLADAMLRLLPTPRPDVQESLLGDTLLLLEAAGLDSHLPTEEHARWLEQVLSWWQLGPHAPPLADALLDLVLSAHRADDEPRVERWLRAMLRLPIHANRLSQAAVRQRALAYLLARYEATDRGRELVDLCWEEQEEGRAARWLAAHGSADEVARLADEGLGSAAMHLSVAEALRQRGDHATALRIAEAGLRYGEDAELLAWLARRDYEEGNMERARERAERAWALLPTLPSYEALRHTTLPADWPTQRTALQTTLAAGPALPHIEILMQEREWDEAAARLPDAGPHREALTETLAHAAATDEPLLALRLLFDLATLRAARGAAGYDAARTAILAAQSLATTDDALAAPFAEHLAAFRDAHRRRRTLLAAIDEAVG